MTNQSKPGQEPISNMIPMVIESGARGERAFDIYSLLLNKLSSF